MYAVITAGGRPAPKDPLFRYTHGGFKALLPIGGKPMIQWVLDALNQSRIARGAVIVGLPEGVKLACSCPVYFLPDRGSLLENNRAGVEKILSLEPDARYALLLTSDVPAISGAMIDWVAEAMLQYDVDFLYPVIEQRVMEARFPKSRRTFLNMKDSRVCGADVMAIHTALARQLNPRWQQIIESRKNPVRQAALLGFDTLFKILLRRLSVPAAGPRLGERLGMTARAVYAPYAELGMDVDKPHQYELVEAYLNGQPV